jgi:large subunit ribosomal protein L10
MPSPAEARDVSDTALASARAFCIAEPMERREDMPRPDKVEKVNEIKDRFEAHKAVLVTEYRGLTVDDMAALRKDLRPSGVELKVTKNTLLRIALRDSQYEPILELIEGPIALAYVEDDIVKAAQSLIAYMRKNPKLKIKGGLVEGRVVQGPDVRVIATLPPRGRRHQVPHQQPGRRTLRPHSGVGVCAQRH